MILNIFRKLVQKTSFGFSVAFISTLWVYPAASYGYYIFYATVDLGKEELDFSLTALVLGTIVALLVHFIHYGLMYRIRIPGFSRSIRLMNRELSDDRIFKDDYNPGKESVIELYDNVVLLPRNNLVAASTYTLSVILFLVFGFQFMFNDDLMSSVYIVMGGCFTVLIHGYFVFNVTEYLVGPYKERLEKIIFNYEMDFRNRYLLSVRNKSLFAVMLVFLCMIILTIFIMVSEKPLLQVFIFIVLSVIAVGLLIFLSINKITISLTEINRATKELAAGGDGLYFPPFLDRELVTFSYHYNRAALEINEIRADLQKKVDERTEELKKAYDRLNSMYKQVQEDMQLAKKIQSRVLAKNFNSVREIKTYIQYYPMSEVGGDIYDISEIRPGYVRIFLADAAGHGVQAALVTMIIKGEYEKVKESADAAALLQSLNDSFLDLYEILSVFFSCVIIDLDLANKKLYYSSAGHPDQVLIRGGKVVRLVHTGKLVGIVKGATYQITENEIGSGDRLLLFTDGLFEQFNENDDVYGEENLRRAIEKGKGLTIEELMYSVITGVDVFIGGKNKISLHDDVTIIGIQIL
ncbi:MAG TPA: SpoIIE family protein phosphatase [Spirochaetota bacterium]|nr:SpoIIE family protein phosphatase [Spirochaetota bacterium]HPI91178.1 SpoIIE family protein phosphatase [Spirochaetota bacterium]HPR47190.1 SpoIIE family protein phosphatase [Spirochaetota bacterium]